MLDDGTVFDVSSKHDKPLKFEVGGGRVIPGFDKAVTGMNLGEEKNLQYHQLKHMANLIQS